MKLRDLIFHLRRNILRDWSDRVASSDDDRLWSDQTLVDFINEGMRRLARRSLILRDETLGPMTIVALRAGISRYTLNPDVLHVLAARYEDDARDLARVGQNDFDVRPRDAGAGFDPSVGVAPAPGRPVWFQMDETLARDVGETWAAPVMQIWPAPTADVAGKRIYLRIARAPARMTLEDLDQSPEIPEDYQIEVLSWAAYRALSVVDFDEGAPERAQQFRAQFDEMVRDARRETMRKMYAAPKWRFGSGGYER